jgi:hypothetical protein
VNLIRGIRYLRRDVPFSIVKAGGKGGKTMRLLKILSVFIVVFSVCVWTTNYAQATIVSGPDKITPPASVNNETPWGGNPGGGVANDHQQGFDEKQNIYLESDLAVDDGVIPAGTRIDSHMIFFNFIDRSTSEPPYSDQQSWTFSGQILGVMSDLYGNLEIASSPLLGSSQTTYPTIAYQYRGLEVETGDWYTTDGNTLTLQVGGWSPGEWIRIVTEASEPVPTVNEYGMIILALLLTMVAIHTFRKRKAKS